MPERGRGLGLLRAALGETYLCTALVSSWSYSRAKRCPVLSAGSALEEVQRATLFTQIRGSGFLANGPAHHSDSSEIRRYQFNYLRLVTSG